MFKSLKTLDPRFREGDRKEVVAGMTKGVGENDGKGVSEGDGKCLATPDLAKRNHSRVFSVIPLPLSVIPAKAGIQSPLSRKTQKQKSLKVRGINNQ